MSLEVEEGLEGTHRAIYDRIVDMGQDPETVQVAILTHPTDGATLIQLHNAGGSFFEALPLVEEPSSEEENHATITEPPPRTGDSGVEVLRTALKDAEQREKDLTRDLKHCRTRLDLVWRTSCEQTRELDSVVKWKDDEILMLNG